MPLDRSAWATLITGTFSLDCPTLKLTPAGTGEASYSGSGYITQDKSGFAIKLFTKRKVRLTKLFPQSKWKAGEVLGKDAFYKLEAIDVKGRRWRASGLLPNIDAGPDGAVVLAHASRLMLRETERQSTTNVVRLIFPTEIPFPVNTVVKTEKKVGDKQRQMSMALAVSRFVASGFEFELERELGLTTLHARLGNTKPSDRLVDDIIDSFNFVTANPIQWSMVEKIAGPTWETLIRSTDASHTSRIGPPLELRSLDSQAARLLDLVLGRCRQSNKRGPGSMQALFQAVISAGSGNLEVEALTLSTSIESLLAGYFSEFGKPTKSLKKDIASAIKVIDSAQQLSPQFKIRLKGSLKGMGSPRAKDFLFKLRDKKLIDPGLIKAYSELRNKSAHGVSIDPTKLQEFLQNCGAVLTLFNLLVFLRVGYTGPYFDYSRLGYPEANLTVTL